MYYVGTDFNSTMQTVKLSAGSNISSVNISVKDDNIVEGNETFSMHLAIPILTWSWNNNWYYY